MFNTKMSTEFFFSSKSHIAFGFAIRIGTKMMRPGKVVFKVFILGIINVFAGIPTEVTGEMLSTEMVKEKLVVEEILLTEITPRMR